MKTFQRDYFDLCENKEWQGARVKYFLSYKLPKIANILFCKNIAGDRGTSGKCARRRDTGAALCQRGQNWDWRTWRQICKEELKLMGGKMRLNWDWHLIEGPHRIFVKMNWNWTKIYVRENWYCNKIDLREYLSTFFVSLLRTQFWCHRPSTKLVWTVIPQSFQG